MEILFDKFCTKVFLQPSPVFPPTDSDAQNWRDGMKPLSPNGRGGRGGFRGVRRGRGGRGRGGYGGRGGRTDNMDGNGR